MLWFYRLKGRTQAYLNAQVAPRQEIQAKGRHEQQRNLGPRLLHESDRPQLTHQKRTTETHAKLHPEKHQSQRVETACPTDTNPSPPLLTSQNTRTQKEQRWPRCNNAHNESGLAAQTLRHAHDHGTDTSETFKRASETATGGRSPPHDYQRILREQLRTHNVSKAPLYPRRFYISHILAFAPHKPKTRAPTDTRNHRQRLDPKRDLAINGHPQRAHYHSEPQEKYLSHNKLNSHRTS